MNRLFIKKNCTSISILLFIFVFMTVQYVKPSIMYKKNGTIRDFGIGYKNKTILPVWLFSIMVAIFSYTLVLYYQVYPNIQY